MVNMMTINKFFKNNKGFTLIEILIVFTLMALLASIAIPNYQRSVVKAREATLKEDLFQMRDAIDQYYADMGSYPSDLTDLTTKKYLRKIPVDPFTQSSDDWYLEYDLSDPESEGGITDVSSGNDDTALDGSSYSEW